METSLSCHATFHDLPGEIIELILTPLCINFLDVVNVSKTCCKFYEVCQSNDLWKRKILQRYICISVSRANILRIRCK